MIAKIMRFSVRMRCMSLRFCLPIALLIFTSALPSLAAPVNFSREVLPILSENCLSCHGQDEGHRKADLRLDTREGVLAVLKPGKPETSDLIERIVSTDEDEVMPPPKSHKPRLTAEQVSTLRRWVTEGAVWGKHWSFEKPVKQPVQGHALDFFVQARLAKEKLQLSPKAPAHTLIRRLSYDLTGLPPTPEELAAFGQDTSPDAVAHAAERLMKSPHYGERMAMWWLDAARYADTDGFQSDAERTNWPWRDWVVNAFNANMRYDQFTLEQFAGDLLPNATPEQKLATCFHRNHMTNGEGGRDPEESRVDYVLDRVNTMGSTWLGLTLGCTQCHSHKFDPITQADYYSLTAFFNSIDEDGKAGGGAKPYLSYQSTAANRATQEAQQLVDERTPLEKKAKTDAETPFKQWLMEQRKALKPGYQAWQPLTALKLETTEGTVLTQDKSKAVTASGPNPRQDDYRFLTTSKAKRITGLKLEILPQNGVLSRGKSGEFILTDLKLQVSRSGSTQVRDILIKNAVADAQAESKNREYGDVKGTLDDDPRNGWTTKGSPKDKPYQALYELAEPLVLESDETMIIELRQRSTNGDANIASFRLSVTDQAGPAVREVKPAPMEQLAASKDKQPDTKLRERLMAQFLEDYQPYQEAKRSLDIAKSQFNDAKKAAGKLNVMVLAERKEPRETFVLVRGVWDKHGDKVKQDVPAAIAGWPQDAPRSRIGLARWINSRDNPLTARVFVNHVWQLLFGAGLARTTEDLGLQGERPTHPELLDWLAVDFMESGWDIQHLIKTIVTSATYQQDSAASPALMARDPDNRLLARGPRYRLSSWMLRDAALRHAGLLNPALGGPPVRPYQPPGVWEELFMGRFKYEPSQGAAQYRRTLYAFWRRAIAPTFLFDSAQRRSCEVRTARTNTPLQALTLLNDETYLEASRALASQMLQQGDDSSARLKWLVKRVLSRNAKPQELTVLQRELDRALAAYHANSNAAAEYLRFGQSHATPTPELAAHTLVASLVLNLDEAITHE